MTTLWFCNSQPGAEISVSPAVNGSGALLVASIPPDWVRAPEQFGGDKRRVLEARQITCPVCAPDEPPCRHLRLEGDLFVAECPVHKFVWYSGKP